MEPKLPSCRKTYLKEGIFDPLSLVAIGGSVGAYFFLHAIAQMKRVYLG